MTETVQGTYRVDLSSLATLGRVAYGGDAIRGDLTTAHPQLLPDGSLVNLVSQVGWRGRGVIGGRRWADRWGAAGRAWLTLCVPPRLSPHTTHAQVGGGFHVYTTPPGAFEQRRKVGTVPHRNPMAPAWCAAPSRLAPARPALPLPLPRSSASASAACPTDPACRALLLPPPFLLLPACRTQGARLPGHAAVCRHPRDAALLQRRQPAAGRALG